MNKKIPEKRLSYQKPQVNVDVNNMETIMIIVSHDK